MTMLITDKEAAQMLGISVRYFHVIRDTIANFPQAVRLGTRCVRWKAAEIQAFVEAL